MIEAVNIDWFTKLPPAERRRKLQAGEPKELTLSQRRKWLADENKAYANLKASVPSAAWLEAADEFGVEFPPGGAGTSMAMSTVSGRYTPAQCLESEDTLDAMSPDEAEDYVHPPSPSAVIILRFELASKSQAQRDARKGKIKSIT